MYCIFSSKFPCNSLMNILPMFIKRNIYQNGLECFICIQCSFCDIFVINNCFASACVNRVSKVVRNSSEDNLEPFKSNMMRFIDRGKIAEKFYTKCFPIVREKCKKLMSGHICKAYWYRNKVCRLPKSVTHIK